MNPIHEETYRGYTIKVYLDDSQPDSPRDWDNLGTMVCWHSRYNLGDEQPNQDSYEWKEEQEDVAIMLPLYLYAHSGIMMNTTGFSCPWDSGQVGWIYVTKEQIRKEYGVKRISAKTLERARQVLVSEVKIYDQYLCGEVYGLVIEDKDGEHVDSCWGFYGDYDDYMIPECKSIIDHCIKTERKEHFERVKEWIKNHVPLQYRTPLEERA